MAKKKNDSLVRKKIPTQENRLVKSLAQWPIPGACKMQIPESTWQFDHTDRDTEKELAITLATAVTRCFYTSHWGSTNRKLYTVSLSPANASPEPTVSIQNGLLTFWLPSFNEGMQLLWPHHPIPLNQVSEPRRSREGQVEPRHSQSEALHWKGTM